SLDVTLRLAEMVDSSRMLVSESGIFTHEDLHMLQDKCGINSFLIGESLMRQQDVATATRKLIEG
ncbi:MAG: hypothetical protein KAI89_08870, partial [Emcibacter sp.]|nr:hypothetical protein [Emcibacter sp.]